MKTPPFFAVQKQKVNGVVTLVATDYTLDPKDLDPSADFRVFADTLTIPAGNFSLPGKNITIYARSIACPNNNNAVLDTSGTSYPNRVLPFNPPKADSGRGAGDGGQNGKHGGSTPDTVAANGQDAGGITINASVISGNLKLNANGGQGQQGQDGQSGGDGIGGRPGDDAIINRVQHDWHHPDGWNVTQATAGGDGGRAGNGGNAGKSGNGGKGGVITVNTVTALSKGQITANTINGKAGVAASFGKKGNPGGAGQGGRIAEKYETGGHFHTVTWELSDQRQPGARDGDAGADGSPASPAIDGTGGKYTANTLTDTSALLINDECLLSQLLLSMRVAEIAYLEKDFTTARSFYQWIGGLTSKASGTSGLPAEFAGLHQQCRALIDQLSQGLDFFGNPLNYVPIVTLDYYQQSLDGMLATGNQIETVYNAYTAYLQQQTHDFTGMQHAIDRANDVIKACKDMQSDLLQQITGLVPVIDQLTDSMAKQYGVLLQADADFQKAAHDLNNGCGWANLLALVKTIISVGLSSYNLFKATSFKDAISPTKDFIDLGIKIDKGKVVEWPNPIGGDVPSISGAWTEINPNRAPDVDDAKKLVLKEEEFDKAIKPYLDLPQAKNYKSQVHDYIGLAQSRNAKLLEYTNALVQYKSVSGKITQKQEEVKRITVDMASQNIPGLIPYRNFLFGLYQDFKGMCLKYLYQENRAYIYWSQADNPFNIVDNSFTGLGVFHSNLKGKIINQINTYSQPDQPINDIKILLTANGSDNRAKQFQQLKENNSISFQLHTDDDKFVGWANVLLTNFKIFIPGVVMPSSGNLYIQLWHQGRVVVISPTGTQSNYTHNQVLSVYEYTLDNGKPVAVAGGSLGGDGTGGNKKRIALSPYATFTIKLPPKFNAGLKLDGVQQIEIHFSGYAVPRIDFTKTYA
jgi:hypothetical protein